MPRPGDRPRLTALEKTAAQAIFRGEVQGKAPCPDCGGIHERACPRVKEKEFHPNGNLVRVRYFRSYDDTGVIWPEDAFDPSDDEGTADGG